MVFRVSRLGPRRLLTADAAAPTPSPRAWCWEEGGFGPWADGAPAHPRSERWREAELFACCAAAASSSAFSCWRTHRSSEVMGSGRPCSSMAAAARFLDARRKKWWCVGVCATIGASIDVGLRPACRRRRCTAMRLVSSRTEHASVAILVTGLSLHRNVLHRASILVPLTGLALHRHALCKLSLTWLGIHAKLLV
jgi:hypothetical protein